MSSSMQDLLDELVGIARQIEAHRTTIWLLEQRQLEVREKLIRAGWTPPKPEPLV